MTTRAQAHALPWHARFGLTWSAGAHPVVLLVLLGAALGPRGLAVITPQVLDVVGAVIPVAVAALGILLGLEITRPAPRGAWRLVARAAVHPLVTGAVVATGLWFLAPNALGVEPRQALVLALVGGVSASMSAMLPAADPDRLRSVAIRMRDLDAFVPTLAGAVLLASLLATSAAAAFVLAAQAAAIALAISAIAWFLLWDATPSTEQRVFSIAALLLVGGIADYLGLSALASGLLAGLFWGLVGGVARDSIEHDVRYLRHPLVVLMLIAAGAQTTVSAPALALGTAYLLCRLVGKMAGAWLLGRSAGGPSSTALASSILPPGVFGIAFALNAAPMFAGTTLPVLDVVVVGSVGAQLLAGLRRPVEPEE
jgi:hypothetical protein